MCKRCRRIGHKAAFYNELNCGLCEVIENLFEECPRDQADSCHFRTTNGLFNRTNLKYFCH